MNHIVSIVLAVIGITLVVMGVMAMDSFGSDVSRFFTGTPTDKSVWMFVAGIVALIAAGVTASFRARSARA